MSLISLAVLPSLGLTGVFDQNFGTVTSCVLDIVLLLQDINLCI